MGGACSMRDEKDVQKIVVRETERKRSLGTFVDNYLYSGVEWVYFGVTGA
jgi:hypothetical protein